jgi:hypothetical protein
MLPVARLEPVHLREVWAHEAHDFTAWLGDNLDFLGDILGMELSLEQREAAVGPFSADLLAVDGRGDYVIIENQLEHTDHDHLGKLLTYMSNLGAKTAVWISSAPCPEHETAVHWLNESLPVDTAVYLLQIEAFRIGDSDPAPRLSIVAGPSVQAKEIGAQKKELAERHVLRREFWTELLDRGKGSGHPHTRISPTTDNWIGASSGVAGFAYNYLILMNGARVELEIDRGDAEENRRTFEGLLAAKERIEATLGAPLEWDAKEGRRTCYLRYPLPVSGLLDRERWPETQQRMVDAMVRLGRALRPEIQRLREGA